MPFAATSFIFDGIPSEQFGLMLYDLDGHKQDDVIIGSKAEIHESRSSRNSSGYHYGVTYNTPLTFQLVFGVDDDNDRLDKFDLGAVSMWLTGHQQHKWLHICQKDMESFRYKCLITELKPISIRGLPVAFEATVQCDGPYAYHTPYIDKINCAATQKYTYYCESNISRWYYPNLEVSCSSSQHSDVLRISNTNDAGQSFELSGLSKLSLPLTLSINGKRRVVTLQDGTVVTDLTNFHFPRVVPGKNEIVVIGADQVVIYSEPPVNIGA